MSNVKQIHIEADVPFNFLEEMPDEDAAFFSRLFITPSMGIQIRFQSNGYVPNSNNGGQTAMYRCEIVGQGALSFTALQRLAQLLKDVDIYDVVDIEDF